MTDCDCNAQRRGIFRGWVIFSVEVCNAIENDGLRLQRAKTRDFLRSIFQAKWAMLLKMTDLDCNAQRWSNSYTEPIFSVEVCNTVKNDGLWLQHTETSDFLRKWFFFHSLCATLLKMTDYDCNAQRRVLFCAGLQCTAERSICVKSFCAMQGQSFNLGKYSLSHFLHNFLDTKIPFSLTINSIQCRG